MRDAAIQWSKHPALWEESRRVAFLLDASDYAEETSEADGLRAAIDASSGFDDWRAAFSSDFLRHAEARRTYDGTSVRALLRMLRNQSHHIRTSPFAELRTREGLLAFVLPRFPSLLLRVFEACHAALPLTADLRSYLDYFGAPALDSSPAAPALVAAAAARTAAEAPALVAAAEAPNSRARARVGARPRARPPRRWRCADGGALAAREPRLRRGRPERAPRDAGGRRPAGRAKGSPRGVDSLPKGAPHAPLQALARVRRHALPHDGPRPAVQVRSWRARAAAARGGLRAAAREEAAAAADVVGASAPS